MTSHESTRRTFVSAIAGTAALVTLPILNHAKAITEEDAAATQPQSGNWIATVSPADLNDGDFNAAYAAKRFILARTDNKIAALDTRCTHKGCAVKPVNAWIFCPCHGAKYDGEGNVLHGPARLPLARHPIRLNENGLIEVDPTRKIPQDDPAASLPVAPATQPGA